MFCRTCCGENNRDRTGVWQLLAPSIYNAGVRMSRLRRVVNFRKFVCGLRGPDNFRIGDDTVGMCPAQDWPLARGLYLNLTRRRRPCRSGLFANGPTEKSGIAFLAAKRSYENHGQKTQFKDAFRLRSMDSLTLTVRAINRPHDSLHTVNSRVHNEGCAGGRAKRLLA